jgi:hypothetical protein
MKAFELIAKEENWCKGAFAKDKEGNNVPITSPNAFKFCMLGAINKCYPVEAYSNRVRHVEEIIAEKYPNKFRHMMSFNDDGATLHEMAIDVLKTADV